MQLCELLKHIILNNVLIYTYSTPRQRDLASAVKKLKVKEEQVLDDK